MKGDMELSVIGKWVILLVVLAIGIGMIIYISDNARGYLRGVDEGDRNTSMIKAESFSESQFRLYLRSCWGLVKENKDRDFTCYILEGNMSQVNPKNLIDPSQEYKLDVSGFDNTKKIVSIKYDMLTKKVIVGN